MPIPDPSQRDIGVWADEVTEFLAVSFDDDGSLRDVVNAADYGEGTGLVDDTAALEEAIAEAGSEKVLVSSPGRTYLVSGELTAAAAGAQINLAGAVIKKSASMTENTLNVTGENAFIQNVVVDGNGADAGGMYGNADGVVFSNCRAFNLSTNAFFSLTGDSTFIACVADGVDDGLALVGSGNGFHAAGGVMRTIRCRALNCVRAGFIASEAASAGSEFDGYSYRCGYGVNGPTNSARCRVLNLVVEDPTKHGGFFSASEDWTFASLTVKDAGLTSGDGASTSLQINGCTGFSGKLTGLNSAGYGLALAGGSSNCRFIAEIDGAGDPGIHISGGASENYVRAYVKNATYALIIGEGIAGSNDSNVVDLAAFDCGYGVYRNDNGSYNQVRIFARDCFTTDATYPGLIDFSVNAQPGATCTGNVVLFVDHMATGSLPKYVAHFATGTSGNYVMDGFDRTHFVTADVLDTPAANFVSPALGAAGSLRA